MELLANTFNTRPIDAETRVILNGIPQMKPAEQLETEKYAKERIQAFIAGASRTPEWANQYIRRETGDVRLQIRWDFELGTWLLERWQDDGYWLLVVTLLNLHRKAPALNVNYLHKLAETLKQHDLSRHDPREYIKVKRMAAEKVKAENRTRSDQALLAAIDSMSSKQIQNFIDVHRAIHTGETVVAHGSDLKSITTMADSSAKAEAEDVLVPTGKALNPGMHPLGYHRKPR